MGRVLDYPLGGRDHSMGVVRQLRPRVNPNHPSLQPHLFDQEDPDVHAADRCVVLTAIEAQAIAGVLRHARGHVPSPRALDEAIALLAAASHQPSGGDQ